MKNKNEIKNCRVVPDHKVHQRVFPEFGLTRGLIKAIIRVRYRMPSDEEKAVSG